MILKLTCWYWQCIWKSQNQIPDTSRKYLNTNTFNSWTSNTITNTFKKYLNTFKKKCIWPHVWSTHHWQLLTTYSLQMVLIISRQSLGNCTNWSEETCFIQLNNKLHVYCNNKLHVHWKNNISLNKSDFNSKQCKPTPVQLYDANTNIILWFLWFEWLLSSMNSNTHFQINNTSECIQYITVVWVWSLPSVDMDVCLKSQHCDNCAPWLSHL